MSIRLIQNQKIASQSITIFGEQQISLRNIQRSQSKDGIDILQEEEVGYYFCKMTNFCSINNLMITQYNLQIEMKLISIINADAIEKVQFLQYKAGMQMY
ncbi:unnamed protein product (macronuclear) [Paramecium tetraurelia]|uniref:Uncharacterized protein n=1 Tax=Paramecium tetraurelia TaxID=5888 RepID=A0DL74_PARTE|nr:uncharacterized protein GSPATT00018108001 [Paramecium tetraurelia]CAK83791.1 unnamed protein product [Paramecium tetraurelia]|eukprot:XP_001451188.1 hypothetical protein (macronuclear) [Paramecium tetraurelia strain d4-2]